MPGIYDNRATTMPMSHVPALISAACPEFAVRIVEDLERENAALRKGQRSLTVKIEAIKPLLQRVAGNRRFMQIAGPCREALNILNR